MVPTRLRAAVAMAASLSVIVLALAPAGALAGKPEKGSDHFVEIFCDNLTGDGGTLFFGATLSDTNGAQAGLEAFGPGVVPFQEPATYVTNNDVAPSGSFVGGAFTFDIPVLDGATGEPAGSAVVAATLEPAGPVEPIDDQFRGGNRTFRASGWFQPLLIAGGMVTLPDGTTFDLVNDLCFSQEVSVTFFGSNPRSFINQVSSDNVGCPPFDGTNQVGFLFVDIDSDRTFAFVEPFLFDPGMDGITETDVVDGHIASDLTYFDFNGNEIGPGAIDVSIAATGERFSYFLRGGTASLRVYGEVYDVEGTLTAPGYEPFDLGDCV